MDSLSIRRRPPACRGGWYGSIEREERGRRTEWRTVATASRSRSRWLVVLSSQLRGSRFCLSCPVRAVTAASGLLPEHPGLDLHPRGAPAGGFCWTLRGRVSAHQSTQHTRTHAHTHGRKEPTTLAIALVSSGRAHTVGLLGCLGWQAIRGRRRSGGVPLAGHGRTTSRKTGPAALLEWTMGPRPAGRNGSHGPMRRS